jgi:hypothetical protein
VTVAATAATLRPRSGPEIIDAAVVLARRAYATCVVVWIVYRMILDPLVLTFAAAWPLWARDGLYNVTYAVPAGALQILLSDSYLGRQGRVYTAFAIVGRRVGKLVAVRVLRLLLIALGLVFFIVPGIGFWAQTCAASPLVVLEDSSVSDALTRSRLLTDGHLRRISLVLAVTLLLWYLVFFSAYGLGTIRYHVLNGPARELVSIVISSMIMPFVQAVVVVLYYDLRIRNEGLDLELIAQAMAVPTARPSTEAEGM